MPTINGIRFADVELKQTGASVILSIDHVQVLRLHGHQFTVNTQELPDQLHQTIAVRCDGPIEWLHDVSFLNARYPSIEGILTVEHSPTAALIVVERPSPVRWSFEFRRFGRGAPGSVHPRSSGTSLSGERLQQALSLNRYYSQFLGWEENGVPQNGWGTHWPSIASRLNVPTRVSERDFASAVLSWQATHGGLLADGVIGRNTWARMRPELDLVAEQSFVSGPFGESSPGGWPSFEPTVAYSPMRMPGRGFLFVVVEMLPEVGARNLVRKVGVIPNDFILQPSNPLARLSPADHALGTPSQWISASNRPFGSPNIQGRPVLMDVEAIRRAGGTIVTEAELIADLQRYARANPAAANRVQRLISAIQGVEGETLASYSGRVRPITGTHLNYVQQAEALWARFDAKAITRAELEAGLARLSTTYRAARIAGRVGRVFMVVGIVLTAVDMGFAVDRSVREQSFRPIAAETIRQVGGWGGAIAGAKLGAMAGAALGIETGPGAIVAGAVGAIIFGAAGYFGADWLADHISEN